MIHLDPRYKLTQEFVALLDVPASTLSFHLKELANAGLDAYFMQPLKLAKPGFVVEQSASLGMVGVQQVLGTVIRRVIGRMDSAQLHSVCGSIGQFMR